MPPKGKPLPKGEPPAFITTIQGLVCTNTITSKYRHAIKNASLAFYLNM